MPELALLSVLKREGYDVFPSLLLNQVMQARLGSTGSLTFPLSGVSKAASLASAVKAPGSPS